MPKISQFLNVSRLIKYLENFSAGRIQPFGLQFLTSVPNLHNYLGVFSFSFWGFKVRHSPGAQDLLLLALHSGIILGEAIWDARLR